MTLSQVTKFSTALMIAIILTVTVNPTWGQDENVLPRTVEWSPDGSMIAVGGETIDCNLDNPDPDNLRIFDADTLEVLFLIPDMGCKVVALDWSPDSTALAMSDVRGLRVWEVETQNFVFTTLMRPSVTRWSPDGDSLAIADLSGTTRTIDLETGELSPQFFITAFHVEWSPDSSQLAIAGFNILSIFDVNTGMETATIEYDLSLITEITWETNGSRLVVYRETREDLKIHVVDANSLQNILTIPLLEYFPASQPLSDISLSPDGHQIAGTGPLSGLYIWATDTGELLSLISEEGIYSTVWNPDGSKLAYVGDIPGGIVIVDVTELEH